MEALFNLTVAGFLFIMLPVTKETSAFYGMKPHTLNAFAYTLVILNVVCGLIGIVRAFAGT